ncbi:MAG: hypothetical protein KDB10_20460 [Acidimicrobiales bacterium]|nr:hypothetical protein [Acidimicrobiales bacterium]MCB9373251.1 hypothetical protein [Microthrixaceae bacterium]
MSEVDLTDKDYTKAILIGIVVGVPLLAAVAFAAFEVAQPDASDGALAWLAVWTGLWAGVFVGGTIAVWNYLRRLEH